MSLVGALKGKGPSGYGYGSTAEEVSAGLDLAGRRYLVTGCSSGLGLETMRVLCLRGATVVGAARSEDKVRQAADGWGDQVVPVACELSEPASVRACVAAVQAQGVPLDGIICNAGIMALPEREVKLGVELQMLTNHVGHFILVMGLLDRLAADGRVVMLSSAAHQQAPAEGIRLDDLGASRGYSPWGNYGQSKLANLLFARELARRLGPPGRVVTALHPGVIHTNLGRHMGSGMQLGSRVLAPLFFKTVPEGAATQVWAAVKAPGAEIHGQYLKDCNVGVSSRRGQDMQLAARLWEVTEALVARL